MACVGALALGTGNEAALTLLPDAALLGGGDWLARRRRLGDEAELALVRGAAIAGGLAVVLGVWVSRRRAGAEDWPRSALGIGKLAWVRLDSAIVGVSRLASGGLVSSPGLVLLLALGVLPSGNWSGAVTGSTGTTIAGAFGVELVGASSGVVFGGLGCGVSGSVWPKAIAGGEGVGATVAGGDWGAGISIAAVVLLLDGWVAGGLVVAADSGDWAGDRNVAPGGLLDWAGVGVGAVGADSG